jgi:hypothetical protein
MYGTCTSFVPSFVLAVAVATPHSLHPPLQIDPPKPQVLVCARGLATLPACVGELWQCRGAVAVPVPNTQPRDTSHHPTQTCNFDDMERYIVKQAAWKRSRMDSSKTAYMSEGAELEALLTQPSSRGFHTVLEDSDVAQIGAVTLVSGLHPHRSN